MSVTLEPRVDGVTVDIKVNSTVVATLVAAGMTVPGTLGVTGLLSVGAGGINLTSAAGTSYITGTWTPIVNNVNLGAVGKYTKIGRLCFISINNVSIGSNIADNTEFSVTGIPFNIAAGGYDFGAPITVTMNDASDGYKSKLMLGRIDSSATNTITCINRSGVTTVSTDDPFNLAGWYTAA